MLISALTDAWRSCHLRRLNSFIRGLTDLANCFATPGAAVVSHRSHLVSVQGNAILIEDVVGLAR